MVSRKLCLHWSRSYWMMAANSTKPLLCEIIRGELTLSSSSWNIQALGRRVLKGDRMPVLKSELLPKNSGAAFELKKGQRLRIAGRSIVDFVAFNLCDLSERFDQARTNTN